MTLYEMKQGLATLKGEMDVLNAWIAEKAADPNVKMDEIKEKQAKLAETTERYELLKGQHDALEKEQMAKSRPSSRPRLISIVRHSAAATSPRPMKASAAFLRRTQTSATAISCFRLSLRMSSFSSRSKSTRSVRSSM